MIMIAHQQRLLLVTFLFVVFLGISADVRAQKTISDRVTISGKVTYEDAVYNPADMTRRLSRTTRRPVRHAMIYVRNKERPKTIYSRGVTNARGEYTLTVPTSAGIVHLRFVVFTRTGARTGFNVRVVRNNGRTDWRSMSWCCMDAADPDHRTWEIDFPLDSLQSRPFNVFDAALTGQEYVRAMVSTSRIKGASADFSRHPLQVRWRWPRHGPTHYNHAANDGRGEVRIDWGHEWADDVVLHEVGHWAQSHFSRDQSPGLNHSLHGLLDPRQAFSEGWAHYFSAAARAHAGKVRYPAPRLFAKTDGRTVQKWFDVENQRYVTPAPPANLAQLFRTQLNELAVASALWDLADNGTDAPHEGDAEAFDTVDGNESAVWDALMALGTATAEPTIFEAWYRQFEGQDFVASVDAAGTWSSTFQVDGAFEQVGIRFYEDGPFTGWSGNLTEPNDTLETAWELDEEELPLYLTMFANRSFREGHKGDEDWFQINSDWHKNGEAVNVTVRVSWVQRYHRAPDGKMDDGGDLALEVRRLTQGSDGLKLLDPSEVFRDGNSGVGTQDVVTFRDPDPDPTDNQAWSSKFLIRVYRDPAETLINFGYYCLEVDILPRVRPSGTGHECGSFRR